MEIGSATTRAEMTTQKNSDSSEAVQRLEKSRQRLEEQLQRVQEEQKSGTTDTSGQDNLQKQIDNIDTLLQALSSKGSVSSTDATTEIPSASYARYDEFVRSNGQASDNPAGIYRLETDENGNQKIVYDKPKDASGGSDDSATEAFAKDDEAQAKEAPASSGEKKATGSPKSGGSGGTSTVNTDDVEAEIKKLKKEKQKIEAEINKAAGDEENIAKLEKRLEEINAELRIKDSDAYKKQYAQIS